MLEINKDNFVALSVSATFDLSDSIQPVGTPLIHCGSTLGLYNSISLGIMSQTDRDLLKTGRIFDQTSVMAYPGSSGGGVYTQDGKCIGLLVRGVGAGLNFIVPARRIVPWAKKMKVEWAVNPAIKVPTRIVRVETPLDDGTACNPVLDESTANRTPTLAPPKCPVIPLRAFFPSDVSGCSGNCPQDHPVGCVTDRPRVDLAASSHNPPGLYPRAAT